MNDIALRMPANVGGTSHNPASLVGVGAFFKRMGDAFMAAQRRRVEREIEHYVVTHGGVLTDEIERRISRQFGA
ncbi:MAG: hypothetical protein R3D67_12445 [Hyphomicrobiaceae bacterium]